MPVEFISSTNFGPSTGVAYSGFDPDYARRGIGRALLERCESEARTRGFRRFELMGTLPGVRLYQALGYRPGEMVHYPVASGVTIEFIPMSKEIEG